MRNKILIAAAVLFCFSVSGCVLERSNYSDDEIRAELEKYKTSETQAVSESVTTTAATEKGTEEHKVSDITGIWLEQLPDGGRCNTLLVGINNSFRFTGHDGDTCEGDVTVEKEIQPDGSTKEYFCFYRYGNDKEVFIKAGATENPMRVLVTETDGVHRFERADDREFITRDLAGEWKTTDDSEVNGRMSISSDGKYKFTDSDGKVKEGNIEVTDDREIDSGNVSITFNCEDPAVSWMTADIPHRRPLDIISGSVMTSADSVLQKIKFVRTESGGESENDPDGSEKTGQAGEKPESGEKTGQNGGKPESRESAGESEPKHETVPASGEKDSHEGTGTVSSSEGGQKEDPEKNAKLEAVAAELMGKLDTLYRITSGGIQTDPECIRFMEYYNGEEMIDLPYEKITEPGLDSMDKIKNYINSFISREARDFWTGTAESMFRTADDGLYMQSGFARGRFIFNVDEGIELFKITDTSFIAVTTASNQLDGHYYIDVVFEDDQWKVSGWGAVDSFDELG